MSDPNHGKDFNNDSENISLARDQALSLRWSLQTSGKITDQKLSDLPPAIRFEMDGISLGKLKIQINADKSGQSLEKQLHKELREDHVRAVSEACLSPWQAVLLPQQQGDSQPTGPGKHGAD